MRIDLLVNWEGVSKCKVCCAEAEAGPVQSEEDSTPDTDYFDRQDLGKLRRRLRKGIEGFRRERELYLELVQEYIEVSPLWQGQNTRGLMMKQLLRCRTFLPCRTMRVAGAYKHASRFAMAICPR